MVVVWGEGVEVVFDVVVLGFGDVFFEDLFLVAWESGLREDLAGEMPAGPGAPGA